MNWRAWVGRYWHWAAWLAVFGILAWVVDDTVGTMRLQSSQNRALVDSLRSARGQLVATEIARAATAKARDDARAQADSAGRVADSLSRVAAKAEARAGEARRQRLSITPPDTTVGDSLRYYKAQTEQGERENELLRQSLELRWDELGARAEEIKAKDGELTLLRAQVAADSIALARAAPLLGNAATALSHSQPRCRVAHLLPCPSRTVAFVAGAVAGVIVVTRVIP